MLFLKMASSSGFNENKQYIKTMKNFRSAKYLVTVWMFLLNVTLLLGQQKSIPSGYYNGTETLSGAPLKTALYNIIKGHTIISYSGLWTAYKTTDKLEIGGTTYVFDMYSVKSDSTSAYSFTFTTDQCGNYSGEGDCYNREHSFPKSWFNDASPMYSDLFHIVPTDGYVNSRRSNYPFGEVTSPTWTSTNGSKLGSCSYPGYTGTVFEPIDEYKGDFARIYFYMATRYENVIAGWPGSDMTNSTSFPCFTNWALNMLIKWNNEDPISTKEINRNESAYLLQHNRNPFIDHPEFVYKIWGGNSPSIIADIVTLPAVPKTTDVVNVSAAITDTEGIGAVVLKWGTNSSSISNSITMGTSGSSLYTTQTAIPPQMAGATVYYKIEVADMNSDITTSSTHSYTIENIDIASPILGITPFNGAIQVPISSKIIISSNESLKNSGGNPLDALYINSAISVANNQGSISYSVSISSDQKLITLTPGISLNYQTSYSVTISNQAFADASGNKTQGVQSTFTTNAQPDIVAPELAFNINNNATNININSQVIISSNEPLLTNTAGLITSTYLTNNLVCHIGNSAGALVALQATIDITKKQITVSFSSPLAYQTVYYFEIPVSVFEDAAGNETNKYTISFTTEVIPDNEAPILTITPPNNATDVELNAFIKITSNEPLLTETGQIIDESYLKSVIDLKLYDVNGVNLSFNAGISNNNQLITIWPSESFTNEITYSAKLNSKAFADIAGNLTDSIQTSFTTKSLNDTKAPAFIAGFPKTDSITSHSFSSIVSMDEPGRIFYRLKLKTESVPTIQQLLESDAVELLEGYDPDTISFEGLTENTAYSLYLLTQDNQSIPNTSLFALKQNITTLGIAPFILAEPVNQMICKGTEVLFVTSVSGTEPLAYQWYFGATPLQDAKDDTLRISSAIYNKEGFYYCKISNNWGFVFSQKAELSFIADVFGGTDNQRVVKDTVTRLDLTDLLLDNPTEYGIWSDIDGSGALQGSIFSPMSAGTGAYRFSYKVFNTCMTDSSIIKVTVDGRIPIITIQPLDALTCTGSEAFFVVKSEGTAPFNYEWNFNDYPIASSDNDTLFLKHINQGFFGNYFCAVSNEWGITYSEPAMLNFYPPITAGTDNQVLVKNTVLEMDLFDYLLNNPDSGGEWIDLDFSQALEGSIFNPNQAGAGIYHFKYLVTNPCTTDSAMVTVTVESPDAIAGVCFDGLTVYPNPSKGAFFIKIPNTLTDISLHLFSPQGTLLKQMQLQQLPGTITLDFSEFGKGIYYIKITGDTKVIEQKLVID